MQNISLDFWYTMKYILYKSVKQPLKSPVYNSLTLIGWELGISAKYQPF